MAIFLIYSGLIGPLIIGSGKVFFQYHFDYYGELGKAMLFGIITLAIIVRRKQLVLQITPWKGHGVWLVLSAASFGLSYYGAQQLIAHQPAAYWPLLTHLFLVASVILALSGCFGPANLRKIARCYRYELTLSVVIAAVFYVFLALIYGLWHVLAGVVLYSVRELLSISGLHAVVLSPRTLLLDKFGIEIAQYCSGIESIALFTGLYVIVGLTDWRRFNYRRLLILFPIGLLLLFGVNILRVFLLILGGYYINPHIAFSLFHTYAGMLLFVVYSAIFWKYSYGWMLQNKPVRSDS